MLRWNARFGWANSPAGSEAVFWISYLSFLGTPRNLARPLEVSGQTGPLCVRRAIELPTSVGLGEKSSRTRLKLRSLKKRRANSGFSRLVGVGSRVVELRCEHCATDISARAFHQP